MAGELMPAVAATAQAGDVVLIGFNRAVSEDDVDRLRAQFKEWLGEYGVKVAFVDHAVSMVVVKGGDNAAEATVPGTAGE